MNPTFRSQFPLLERMFDGRQIVHLDSASTSLKPLCVLDAERAYSTQLGGNIHRGQSDISIETSDAYEAARRATARFLGAAPEEVVFVRNTTEALGVVATGLRLDKTDTVLVSRNEHHSNLAPWLHTGAQVVVLEHLPTEPLTPDQLGAALGKHRPKVFAVAHASNVTGVINPVSQLGAQCRAQSVLCVVDAAQSAPHVPIDVMTLNADFLAFSGHKMFGPTGIGVLWGRGPLLRGLRPTHVGGGTVAWLKEDGFEGAAVPQRLEPGTPNISGVLGLARACEWITAVSFGEIARHNAVLADALEAALVELPATRILMSRCKPRLPIAAMAWPNAAVSPNDVARMLSQGHQTMTRSGFHCAQPLHRSLGLDDGSLRLSAGPYNTPEEIATAGRNVRTILERFYRI